MVCIFYRKAGRAVRELFLLSFSFGFQNKKDTMRCPFAFEKQGLLENAESGTAVRFGLV